MQEGLDGFGRLIGGRRSAEDEDGERGAGGYGILLLDYVNRQLWTSRLKSKARVMPQDHLGLVAYRDHAFHTARQLLCAFACLGDEVELHFNAHVDERLRELAGADVIRLQHAQDVHGRDIKQLDASATKKNTHLKGCIASRCSRHCRKIELYQDRGVGSCVWRIE